jgi:cytochrome P450
MNELILADPLSLVAAPDPYPRWRELRDHAPVCWFPDRNLWAVSRYDDARRVMGDAELFSSQAMATAVTRPGRFAAEPVEPSDQAVSIIGTDGDEHARLRRVLNRAFTPKRMEAMRDRIIEITDGLLRHALASSTIDIQTEFANLLPVAVIAKLFEVDADHESDFRRWAEAMLLAVFGEPTTEQAEGISTSLSEMNVWLDATIADRGRRRDDDVISILLRAEDGERGLTHDEMSVFAFTVLVAGSITTSFLIGNGVLTLARQPHLIDRLHQDPALIPAFVEEVLRFDSPAQVMVRTAAHPTEISGMQISSGDTLAVLLGSANRDERTFADPDRFLLERGGVAPLAFGYGPHYCLGAALARLESRIAFERLIATQTRLETIEPVDYFPSEFFRGPATHMVAIR